jgi:hypothetical protein
MTVTVLLQVSVSVLLLYKTGEEAVKKTMKGEIEIIR